MTTDGNRGEVELNIGEEDRLLHFRTAEIMQLESMLKMDCTTWLQTGQSQVGFCVYAVMAGLSRTAAAKKISLGRVQNWFDAIGPDRSINEIQKQLLQAIARGKPGEEGIELAKVIDEIFVRRDSKETPTPAS